MNPIVGYRVTLARHEVEILFVNGERYFLNLQASDPYLPLIWSPQGPLYLEFDREHRSALIYGDFFRYNYIGRVEESCYDEFNNLLSRESSPPNKTAYKFETIKKSKSNLPDWF